VLVQRLLQSSGSTSNDRRTTPLQLLASHCGRWVRGDGPSVAVDGDCSELEAVAKLLIAQPEALVRGSAWGIVRCVVSARTAATQLCARASFLVAVQQAVLCSCTPRSPAFQSDCTVDAQAVEPGTSDVGSALTYVASLASAKGKSPQDILSNRLASCAVPALLRVLLSPAAASLPRYPHHFAGLQPSNMALLYDAFAKRLPQVVVAIAEHCSRHGTCAINFIAVSCRGGEGWQDGGRK